MAEYDTILHIFLICGVLPPSLFPSGVEQYAAWVHLIVKPQSCSQTEADSREDLLSLTLKNSSFVHVLATPCA